MHCGATLRVAIHDAERRATLISASPRRCYLAAIVSAMFHRLKKAWAMTTAR